RSCRPPRRRMIAPLLGLQLTQDCRRRLNRNQRERERGRNQKAKREAKSRHVHCAPPFSPAGFSFETSMRSTAVFARVIYFRAADLTSSGVTDRKSFVSELTREGSPSNNKYSASAIARPSAVCRPVHSTALAQENLASRSWFFAFASSSAETPSRCTLSISSRIVCSIDSAGTDALCLVTTVIWPGPRRSSRVALRSSDSALSLTSSR